MSENLKQIMNLYNVSVLITHAGSVQGCKKGAAAAAAAVISFIHHNIPRNCYMKLQIM